MSCEERMKCRHTMSSFLFLSAILSVALLLTPTLAVTSDAAASRRLHHLSSAGSSSISAHLTAPLFQPIAILAPSTPPPSSIDTAAAAASNNEYNESLSMHLLLHSSAAYTTDPSRCLTRYNPSFRLTHTFNTSLYNTHLYGYAGVDDAQHSIVFAFQGSMDAEQLWQELLHDTPVNISAAGTLLVNQYFYVGSMGLLPAVSAAYANLTTQYANYSVHFTGHSLGGALAHVLSYLLLTSTAAAPSPHNILLYTYGQPRTGNSAFASASSQYVPHHYRVVHWRDLIPHLPPCPTQHGQCSASNATAGYYGYHAPTEVWYPSTMPKLQPSGVQETVRRAAPPPPVWTVCAGEPVGEDETCSDGLDWWWIEDHYYYFSVEVGDFCTSLGDVAHRATAAPATE